MNPSIQNKFLRLPELEEITGLKRSSVYNRLNPSSKYFDPSFPKSISLSATGKGSVAWLASEISAWMESRVVARADNN
ncbi:helix-turn-helix transcriptional regulator [Undibacterium flavidum]|uniref:AlpA family phage regulatory protein n=1 Tax=Undibacterium flavidum TaxID=2762297 RepID=A0ABR6YE87_9BURK|nr:AlpA family phage regulatory protein [Undibacterium flavidum]MBC3874880.1 AlpA family phage regulatory protein [Undibacterium flavidum]